MMKTSTVVAALLGRPCVGDFLGENLERDLIAASKQIKHCGDYGLLYYHPDKREVHWTAGDGDGPPNYTHPDEIVKLLKLPGVQHVEVGDEWSPDEDDGWLYLSEAEEPEAVEPARDELHRLLPTQMFRLKGNTLFSAPEALRTAQSEWLPDNPRRGKWVVWKLQQMWPGLPVSACYKILRGEAEIEVDGNSVVVTVKNFE